jgi:hypothetical protein
MINSVITIGGHLIQRILCDESGASISMPPFYPGLYQFKLKLVSIVDDGSTAVVFPTVTSLSASIGKVYAEPLAGTFRLRYGAGTQTAPIFFNEDAEDFKAKLAALTLSTTYGLNEVYQPTPSTWMCKFDTPPDPVPFIDLQEFDVQLQPETFVRIRQFFLGGDYWIEIRLVQGPLASTAVLKSILPPPPEVSEIRRGYTQYLEDGLTVIKVNEVQKVYVPPGFLGTYILNFSGRQTRPLSANDGAANIQTALNELWLPESPLQTRFTVTNPEQNSAYIQFVGPFAGQGFDPTHGGPFQIIVPNVGTSDLAFDLNLNTAEVASALQTTDRVEAIMEVILTIVDPAVETDPGQDIVLFQAPVSILRPLHWEGLIDAAPINWLLPPNPKDYVPFDINEVVTGTQSYSTSFGDGTALFYGINHGLNSQSLTLEVRENSSGGARLRDDQYSVVFDNANLLTVTFPTAPAANSKAIVIFSHPVSNQFANHHHDIAAIDGLQGQLDNILFRLSVLEAYLPTPGSGVPPGGPPIFGGTATDTVMTVNIPDIWNVVPTNRLPTGPKPTDPTKLPSQGLLLPAVHEATALGNFTAAISPSNLITLGTSATGLVNGQRVRIDPAPFVAMGQCTFDDATDTVGFTSHGLVAGRRIQFTGSGFPTTITPNFTYYVVAPITTNTFQIATVAGGDFLPITGDADPDSSQILEKRAEPPGGLEEAVDYFMISPTSTTFKLSATIDATGPGAVVPITSVGFPPMTMSTIADAPALDTSGHLPDPHLAGSSIYIGNAYSVRTTIPLTGGRGIRATVVGPGDIVACDGRLWYPVTRSDSPGKNSFYPVKMENEIFRLAINDRMLAAATTLTVTWSLEIRMYKHTSNIQYLMVVEYADLPSTLVPDPTGPNLYAVVWNKVPILQQRIIATELSFQHEFGVQVLRLADNRMRTNKKIYGVEVSGDSIPPTANFALRARLIEFDTEDNVKDAQGLVYYAITKASGNITKTSGTTTA